MDPVWKKLNYKAQSVVVVLDAPASFSAALESLGDATVHRRVGRLKTVEFAIAFATTQRGLDAAAAALTSKAADDATLWFAYPKATSKRYRCEFNRDSGWAALGAAGYEPVRQVAIDEDWSALRFRQVARIGRMTRDAARAISAEGKRRLQAKGR